MGRKGATDPVNPVNLARNERAAEAVRMRIQGHTFEHIADTLGYVNRSSAYRSVMTALKAVKATPAAELAQLEQQRLDIATVAVMNQLETQAKAGTVEPGALAAAVLSLVRVQTQRARYVQVYTSDASGAQHVGAILDQLLRGVAVSGDTTDPMTISEPVDDEPTEDQQ